MAKFQTKLQGCSLGVFSILGASQNQTKLCYLVVLGKGNVMALLSGLALLPEANLGLFRMAKFPFFDFGCVSE